MIIKRIVQFLCLALLLVVAKSCISPSEANTRVASSEHSYTLVWSDEFEIDGLPDPDRWSYDVGNGCPHICGWGNNELQYYTGSDIRNSRIQNGHLIIEAHKHAMGDQDYTSARLSTRHKGDWKYGKISIRAKLPSGRGTWPAIWMLPTHDSYGGWPISGEIDIMEHVGYAPDSIYGTVHTSAFNHMIGTQVTGGLELIDVEQGYHTYTIEWNQDHIHWSIDGSRYHSFDNLYKTEREWPFDQDFHLIMNLAIGGNWGGKHGVDTTIWPQRMLVDWVRVYQ